MHRGGTGSSRPVLGLLWKWLISASLRKDGSYHWKVQVQSSVSYSYKLLGVAEVFLVFIVLSFCAEREPECLIFHTFSGPIVWCRVFFFFLVCEIMYFYLLCEAEKVVENAFE